MTNIKQEDIVTLEEMLNTMSSEQIEGKPVGTATQHWLEQGEARGIQIEKNRSAIKIAIRLKKANTPVEVISKATSLDGEFIRSL